MTLLDGRPLAAAIRERTATEKANRQAELELTLNRLELEKQRVAAELDQWRALAVSVAPGRAERPA